MLPDTTFEGDTGDWFVGCGFQTIDDTVQPRVERPKVCQNHKMPANASVLDVEPRSKGLVTSAGTSI